MLIERLNPEEVNQDLQKAIGIPIDSFTTFNKRKRNFICLSGLTYPKTRLEEFENLVNSNKDTVLKIKQNNLELNADIAFCNLQQR